MNKLTLFFAGISRFLLALVIEPNKGGDQASQKD